jgi:pyrrolysine biosynthesis protein PylD
MTRLLSDDILDIVPQLKAYDEELFSKTGHSLRQIACHAVGQKENDARGIISRLRVGIVPIGWGQGVIEGFGVATAGILRHLGFDTFVTGHSDISGLAEAYEKKADVVFLSDDNDFVALNVGPRQHVHNAAATGKGFAAGLDLMAGGLVDQKVLVLGCGAVGRAAALTLLSFGAIVSVYDTNAGDAMEFKSALSGQDSDRVKIQSDFDSALAGHSLVVDATNAAGIIHANDISPQTFIAAPGMPLGLSPEALEKVSDRFLHDPLQIGVATMGMEIVRQISQIDRKLDFVVSYRGLTKK